MANNLNFGLYLPDSATFYLYEDDDADTMQEFQFEEGYENWYPVSGNFNGQGTYGLGVYDGGTFVLDNDLDGEADETLAYEDATDDWVPLTGNFEGSTYGVGFYDRAGGKFYLDFDLDGEFDEEVRIGPKGNEWQGVIGDFDGDGEFDLGLWNPLSAVFHMDTDRSGGIADESLRYGDDYENLVDKDLIAVTGNFGGTGDGLGLYDPATGKFYADADMDGTIDAEWEFDAEEGKIPVYINGEWVLPDDGGGNGEPGEGKVFRLTENADYGEDFVGTEYDDTYNAPITTVNFANGNTLNTGDELDGNGGSNTLKAEIINDGFFQSGLGAVRPTTENIQNVEINAILTTGVPDGDGRSPDAGDTVYLDAADMYDIEHIGSYDSNASLVIQDLTTKTSDGGVRNTDTITIHMDHTQNVNSTNNPSDLTVYFDENYLLSGQEAEGKAFYYLLDQDADLEGDPLLDEHDVDGIRFSLGDDEEVITLRSDATNDADTHVEFVASLQEALNDLIADGVVPEGTTLTLDESLSRTTYLDDGSVSSPVPAIVLTSGDGSRVTPVGYSTVEGEPGEFNLWTRLDDTYEVEDLEITTNIELYKAGRGSEGGDLIVGGKSQSANSSGIPVFEVNVLGGEDKPSNIGVLNSTNGDLHTVNVTTDESVTGDDGYADLTIRDLGGSTDDVVSTDVQNFNSSTFKGNMNLTTTLDEQGNGAHVYNLGSGNDTLDITFDDFGGTAGDSLTVSTGGGNDTIMIDGDADLEALLIGAGDGDNTVFYSGEGNVNEHTWGEGAIITSGSGDDAIYLNEYWDDDSGWEALSLTWPDDIPQEFYFFEGKLQIEVGGVESEWVDIDYDDYKTSREDIRAAVMEALASNTALADMVEVRELTDGTLEMRSLANGDHEVNVDIRGPVANPNWIEDTDNNADYQAGAGNGSEWPIFNDSNQQFNQISLSDLEAAWETWFPGTTAFADLSNPGDWTSWNNVDDNFHEVYLSAPGDASEILDNMDILAELIGPYLSSGMDDLEGPDALSSSGNMIDSGAGDDLIVLMEGGPRGPDGNVVVMTASNFGTNTIVNFDATIGQTAPADWEDELDFTSYLDSEAAERGESVGNQDARVDEGNIGFTFQNDFPFDPGDTLIDHNSMHLWSFADIWTAFDATNDDQPANFESFSAGDLETFFNGLDAGPEIDFGDFVTGSGSDPTALGNNFLIFVGKDGDITVDEEGDLSFDLISSNTDSLEDDGVFKVFEGVIDDWNDADSEYGVSFTELGTIDLAGVDLSDLTANNFFNTQAAQAA